MKNKEQLIDIGWGILTTPRVLTLASLVIGYTGGFGIGMGFMAIMFRIME